MPSADLGGLGAKEGTPTTFNWKRASIFPLALPWLVIVLLLAVKPNRNPRAWWILAPLACVAWSIGLLPTLFPNLRSDIAGLFQDLVGVLAFSLAAVWLLGAYQKSRHRFLNFLGFLGVFLGVSLPLFLLTQDWSALSSGDQVAVTMLVQVGIVLAVSVFMISAAAALAGVPCRRRYRPLALSLWLILGLFVLWGLVIGSFALLISLGRGDSMPIREFLLAVLSVTGVCFAAVLPLLLLSFANGFYRERLIHLLRLAPEPEPAAGPPPVTSMPAATISQLRAAAQSAVAREAGDRTT